ncbi:hypothetical protein GCM10023320_12430 [Pseudonocardia adelaidensis]|uniref:Uncharacterized protein n=1 Tax=Pseudonocardia adelaidensis TaxID=648754 RepID=A0ABP9NCY3_9PSEU
MRLPTKTIVSPHTWQETVAAPAALRFGVSAWPAIAAAIVAHPLHLRAIAPRPPQVLAIAPHNALSGSPSPSGRTPEVQSDQASSGVPPETTSDARGVHRGPSACFS